MSVSVVVGKEIGMARRDVMIRRAEDYFVFVLARDTLVILAFTVARDLEMGAPRLRSQYIPVHLAAIEMIKRHIGIVAQRADRKALVEFVQYISGHRMQIGQRL